MRPVKATGVDRILCGLLAVLLVTALLLSAFCIAHEAGHDCTGDDCPICACVRLCEAVLRQLGSGVFAVFTAVVPVALLLFAGAFRALAAGRETPVSRKVRLNN